MKNAICEELAVRAAKRKPKNQGNKIKKEKENSNTAEKNVTTANKIKKIPKEAENSLPKKDKSNN